MHDVIVVGGGPVGSYIAGRLAEKGRSVLVMEQKERLDAPVCCTGILSQECVSSFALHDAVIFETDEVNFHSPSRFITASLRKLSKACIVDRRALNHSMGKRAQQSGVQYLLSHSVTGLAIDAKRALVYDNDSQHEAQAVVVANGFRSKLAADAGLGRVNDFVVGTQAEVSTYGLDRLEVYFNQELAPGFFGWLVPTAPQRALVGLAVRYHPGYYLRKFLELLKARGQIVSSDAEIRYRGIPLKPLSRTFARRVLVVGDAAGQVKPTTGGGIYYGLLCAESAAKTLHAALSDGDLSARGLARYERAWKDKLEQELKLSYWARRLYRHLSNRRIDRIFDIIIEQRIDKSLLDMDDISFDWHSDVLRRVLARQSWAKALSSVIKLPF